MAVEDFDINAGLSVRDRRSYEGDILFSLPTPVGEAFFLRSSSGEVRIALKQELMEDYSVRTTDPEGVTSPAQSTQVAPQDPSSQGSSSAQVEPPPTPPAQPGA